MQMDFSESMDRMKAVLVMAAALMFAASPIFSGSFGGFDPNQFPEPQTDPPIVPAGYAFAIWGLIYAYTLISAGFGLLRRDTDAIWDKTRWLLIASLAVGASWISVANISPLWASVLIWIMLITSLLALFRARRSKDRWLLQVPLAIYAGWLTAASFVSIGLVGAGYGVLTDQGGWAWIALSAALVTAGVVQLRLGQTPEYGLTVCWALIAIFVRNLNSYTSFAVVALAGAITIGLTALHSWRKHQTTNAA